MGHFVGFILIPITAHKSLLRPSFETASAIVRCAFDELTIYKDRTILEETSDLISFRNLSEWCKNLK